MWEPVATQNHRDPAPPREAPKPKVTYKNALQAHTHAYLHTVHTPTSTHDHLCACITHPCTQRDTLQACTHTLMHADTPIHALIY